MPITFDAQHNTFKLDTVSSSYIIKIYEEGYLLNLYYGAPIPDAYVPHREKRWPSASFSLANPRIGENGFTPDTTPMEYGCNGAADFRISALAVRNANGDSVTDIRYTGHKITAGKPEIPGMPSSYAADGEAETLEIYTLDAVTGVKVTLYYTVFAASGVMTRRVRVENAGAAACELERALSLCVDLPCMDYDLITLHGRHNRERYMERRPLAHGLQGVESKRGVSSHSQNPFAALAARGATEEYGEVYAFNFVYSGNFSALAECDHNATTRFVMGINPTDFGWHLEPGEFFDAPEVLMVYTNEGLGGMSRCFHRFCNEHIIRGRWKNEKRPLLINSWEAAYFDFDTDKLVAFAHEAKQLGIELLVMDDGWFGVRNSDNCSLGDWYVNEDKLPGGLAPLIERVNAEGLKFGIWYEPEMISPDSDLYRAHPDWCVHVAGREPMQGRRQYVLDVSRADVRDNIWQQMYAVLSTNKIDYIKWDFNRNISDAGSALLPPERKKEFFHRFILGTYDLMNRLVTTFPDILFENCSGGGGRFDPAMLCYSPQIWTSDNTDPIERLPIQFGTSLCYPASVMGAHVSACPRTGFATRGNVAMWGTFGYELDPRKLTAEERETAKAQVAEYHASYDLIRRGDLYRLISPFEDPHRAVWEIVSPEKDRAMLTLVTMRRQLHAHLIVRLRGLDPARCYKNETTGEICSGALLMNAGIVLSGIAENDGESVTVYFTAVE
ncbi:MAG: alpha-galactosidase [Oscillospiraceae bacterium]|nr:alpha-galactosidase [Oscillospiraceae bacterium]